MAGGGSNPGERRGAHPTEVRRKSTIDREMEIAQLLARRDRGELTPEEEAANGALRRAVLTLWRTHIAGLAAAAGAGASRTDLIRPGSAPPTACRRG
jgi:Phosphoenolpyruvate carboxylase